MKINKLLIITIILCISAITLINSSFAYEYDQNRPQLREYEYFTITKGTFFRGIMQQEVSTEKNIEGDSVRLINQFDINIKGTTIIPQNSIFIGYISKLHEPIRGRDGYLKMEIVKIIFPDSQVLPVKAHIWTKKDGLIGGATTKRSGRKKIPHYPQWHHKGIVQLVPGGERFMGKNTYVKAGEEFTIQLDENLTLRLAEGE